MDFRDLPPRRDPKGGSPKTPIGGIPVAEFQTYAPYPNGNGIWRAIAAALGGMLIGMTVAWFTALQGHGVTQKEMEEYVRMSNADQDKYSPWLFDKPSITGTISRQEQQLGVLQQKIDLATRVIENQNTIAKP